MATATKFAADAVLFARTPGESLHILLIQRRWAPFEGCWALPGGHVEPDETALQAARRELAEETGLVAPQRMECVGWYDAPYRDPRGRVISAAYTAVLDELPEPVAADDAAAARWVPLAELEADMSTRLAFDHDRIVADALTTLHNHGWSV